MPDQPFVTKLATDIFLARSQGATSLSPALVGALTRFPMPSLILTLLLARREAETTTVASAAPAAANLVPVPDVIRQTVTGAADRLLERGLVVTLSARHDEEHNEGVVISQSIKDKSVPVGTSVRLVVSLGAGKKKEP
jgi:hypothetical protein